MNKILIVGLGLIGGSYAKGLTKRGYNVYGYNRNKDAIDYAKKNKIIVDGSSEFTEDFISGLGEEWHPDEQYSFFKRDAVWKNISFDYVRNYLECFDFWL